MLKYLSFYGGYLLCSLQSALELDGSNELGFSVFDKETPYLYHYYVKSYQDECSRVNEPEPEPLWPTLIKCDPTCKDIDLFVSQIIKLRAGIQYKDYTLSGYGNVLVSINERDGQVNFDFSFGDFSAHTALIYGPNQDVFVIEPVYDDRVDFHFTFSNGEIKPLDEEE